MAAEKKRLDVIMVERGLAATRAKAQGMIMAGEVLVNGTLNDKPGSHYRDEIDITVKAKPKFVSRGGEKLEGALLDFKLDVSGRIAADVGASTGGFTDCLLQFGAAKVYAIDVGYGQLAHKLRTDDRVVIMERTNARYVEALAEPVNLVVIDASFISLRLILPAAKKWLAPEADLVALIKPQFEAGKDDVGKGGVVRRSEIHARVLLEILEFSRGEGFTVAGLTRSPLTGPAGNIEFLVRLHQGGNPLPEIDFAAAIDSLLPPN
jgi:23S rRNA (cytidine1920-2'-O)/16S rRNA (cytidine1409-2'-O)-methyltransferase